MTHSRVTKRSGNLLTVSFRKSRKEDAFALYIRASSLDEDRRTMPEAIDLYEQAIRLDPNLAKAYTNLGNVCFRLNNDAAEADRWYTKALQVDENQPEAHFNLGYLASYKHEWKLAIWLTKKAIALDPKFSDAYFQLADVLEKSGDAHRAAPYWKRFLELSPTGEWADIAKERLESRGAR